MNLEDFNWPITTKRGGRAKGSPWASYMQGGYLAQCLREQEEEKAGGGVHHVWPGLAWPDLAFAS